MNKVLLCVLIFSTISSFSTWAAQPPAPEAASLGVSGSTTISLSESLSSNNSSAGSTGYTLSYGTCSDSGDRGHSSSRLSSSGSENPFVASCEEEELLSQILPPVYIEDVSLRSYPYVSHRVQGGLVFGCERAELLYLQHFCNVIATPWSSLGMLPPGEVVAEDMLDFVEVLTLARVQEMIEAQLVNRPRRKRVCFKRRRGGSAGRKEAERTILME